MSDLTEFQALATELIGEFGTTATLTIVTGTMGDDGVVTEATTSQTVRCTDLVDESRRYAATDTSQSVTGTLYLSGESLLFTPAAQNRIAYQGRAFVVVAVFPYRIQGGVAAWRLDIAEVGNG